MCWVLLLRDTGRDDVDPVLLDCSCRLNGEVVMLEGDELGFSGERRLILEPKSFALGDVGVARSLESSYTTGLESPRDDEGLRWSELAGR